MRPFQVHRNLPLTTAQRVALSLSIAPAARGFASFSGIASASGLFPSTGANAFVASMLEIASATALVVAPRQHGDWPLLGAVIAAMVRARRRGCWIVGNTPRRPRSVRPDEIRGRPAAATTRLQTRVGEMAWLRHPIALQRLGQPACHTAATMA